MSEIPFGLGGLFFIMIVQVIVPPIPAEVIVVGSGKLYGLTLSTLVAGSGLFAGSLIAFYLGEKLHEKCGRFFDRDRVRKVLERFKKYDTSILWVRVLPYNPSDLISYAAGIANIHRAKFLWITGVTSYLRCFVLSYFGDRISDLKEVFIVAFLLLFSAFFSWLIFYKA